jgi:hypothetical protein
MDNSGIHEGVAEHRRKPHRTSVQEDTGSNPLSSNFDGQPTSYLKPPCRHDGRVLPEIETPLDRTGQAGGVIGTIRCLLESQRTRVLGKQQVCRALSVRPRLDEWPRQTVSVEVARQQLGFRIRTQTDSQSRLHDVQLTVEKTPAVVDLVSMRRPVVGRVAVHNVRDKDFFLVGVARSRAWSM